MPTQWNVIETDLPVGEVAAAATGLPLSLSKILASRGMDTREAAEVFLHPSLNQLHDPSLLRGMAEAVDRILLAIRERQTILIYGDYDVDGTIATVLLKVAIDRITPSGQPSLVRYHIPHRIREGYGMQQNVLGDAALDGVRLVISVDTGIRAFAAAQEAQTLGIDLIITDHHLPDGLEIPTAIAVINPKQPGCEYPFKELCGAGIAFKLAHALLLTQMDAKEGTLQSSGITQDALQQKLLPSFLKLLAIATVADSVPLVDENRTIVALGLKELSKPAQPGLRSLMHLAKVGTDASRPITSTDVAFRLAPRINAAGRMDLASDVVDLFLTRDTAHATQIAEKLHRLNDERRSAEQEVLATVDIELDRLRALNPDLRNHGCLILDGEGWHRGVIGILASRVVERTGLPALVVATEDGIAHGSGRSIEGFHLLDALTHAHEEDGEPSSGSLFTRFGGHAHAVGFSLPSTHLPHLRQRLTGYALGKLTETLLSPPLLCDAEIAFSEITREFIGSLRELEPFGVGHREPLFLSRRAVIVDPPRILKEKHLRLRLQQQDGTAISCLCWSRTTEWPLYLADSGLAQGSTVDVAFRIRENLHPDFGGPELELHAIRPSE